MPSLDDHDLLLAAEDCSPEEFDKLHRFSKNDERLVLKLMAHGPVLIRGGRGSGKSALMIEAARRLLPQNPDGMAVGIYLSLRHLELLKRQPGEYERALCEIITRDIRSKSLRGAASFDGGSTVEKLRAALADLAGSLGRRIVLYFDDAAHIGREASLAEFFDVFRTISSSTVSCKAAIYPGVTRFGTRFDVFNDATVLDVSRSEESPDFADLFSEITCQRFGNELPDSAFTSSLDRRTAAAFLAQAVIGNMRAFLFACNTLADKRNGATVGLHHLSEVLLSLASNHFWPLLEELRPKLGIYEPMVGPARHIAEVLFGKCATAKDGARQRITVHRDLTERLSKPFEILEYVGFIAKREGSRALKSGGRGPRYSVNLCNLLESMSGSRLTREVFSQWREHRYEPAELNAGAPEVLSIDNPPLGETDELGILRLSIDTLAKSPAYPYGLTSQKIGLLKSGGFLTVGDLASATDAQLMRVDTVGESWARRIRNVTGQAIWM